MTIRKEKRTTYTTEVIDFIAVDEEGRDILGSNVHIYRTRTYGKLAKLGDETPFSEWKIIVDSGGSTYEKILPHVTAINAAMEFLKQQEEGGGKTMEEKCYETCILECKGNYEHFVCGKGFPDHVCGTSWGCCSYCNRQDCDGRGNYHTCPKGVKANDN